MKKITLWLLSFITLISLNTCFAADSKEELTEELTTVRIQSEPELTFSKQKKNLNVHIKLTARTVGSVDAEDVEISAKLPGGEAVLLEGPLTIKPNKKAEYLIDHSYMLTTKSQKVTAKASCSNCR